MQVRSPDIVKPDIPSPDPMVQWAILGSLTLAFGKKLIEWFANVGSWFVTKDQSENDLIKTMVEFQHETIKMLIKAKLE